MKKILNKNNSIVLCMILFLVLSITNTFACNLYQKKLEKWCSRCKEKDSIVTIIHDTIITKPVVIEPDSNEIHFTINCDSLNQATINYYIKDTLSKIKSNVIITKEVLGKSIDVKNRKGIDTIYVKVPISIPGVHTYTTLVKWKDIPISKWTAYLIVTGKMFNILMIIILSIVGFKIFKKVGLF